MTADCNGCVGRPTEWLFFFVLAGVLLSTLPAQAQIPLACDAVAQETIATSLERVQYTITAAAGERVRIDTIRTGGDDAFVPYWRLLDGNGVQVHDPRTDRHCGNYGGYSVECTVPAGSFRVDVSNGGTGLTGAFEARFTRLSAPCESLAVECEVTPPHGLADGVGPALDRDLFAFPVGENERVRIDTVRAGGDAGFVPYWRLLDVDGVQIHDPQTDRHCGNYGGYSVECTVPAGTVRVEVSNGGTGTVGTYQLQLTRLSAPCESPQLQCDVGHSAQIGPVLDRDLLQFVATDGERVRVDVQRTAGDEDFVPYWRLLNGNGVQVHDPQTDRHCGNYGGYSVECSVPAGTYRAEVSNGGLATVGTYELLLTLLNRTCTPAGSTTTSSSTVPPPSTTTTSTVAPGSTTTSSPVSTTTTTTLLTPCAPFSEDFEDGSLARWAVTGRQLGSGSVTVVARNGSKVGHVAHQSFTEIGLSRTVGFSPDCVFEFDMEATTSSQPPPAPNYYASAGVAFALLDAADVRLGSVSYLRASTSFPFDDAAPDPVREAVRAEEGWKHYRVTAQDLLGLVDVDPSKVAKIVMTATSYGSTYPYPAVSGDVWFDNVQIGPAATTSTTLPPSLPICARPTTADGTSCDNGNTLGGDVCQAGTCVDAICQSSADGAACNDGNACTLSDACHAGMCVPGSEPCRVELPCATRGAAGCSIDVVCNGPCKVSVDITVRARRRARCRAVLVEVTAGRNDADGVLTQARAKKKARRLSKVAEGEVDESGALVLRVKLNKVGRKLLGNIPVGGVLPAQADVTIQDSKQDGGEKRLLPQLIKLVRG